MGNAQITIILHNENVTAGQSNQPKKSINHNIPHSR
ncbi:hypothetical protein B6N60_03888 [Richelia sinica FACHB-800]|uniref:Uncharacterized protein n=1 Tax=Richelia sinica FACHB-800 TaxID=1357546 RepID=A0A975TAF2_9NOST|nr:hypothetical protein B6N60_03888 [Richelia sinica FACHB-800]